MHEDLKERLKDIENGYNGKEFWAIVNQVKKDNINDDELLNQISRISQKKFRDDVSLRLNVPAGNLLEFAATTAAVFFAFQASSDWVYYLITLVLMTTFHPLSHYLAGSLLGIRFTHYYLNGPARIEPTLKIDYFSYLKASGRRRALMHVSGVLGTVAAPLVSALIALDKGASDAAMKLVYLFILVVVFELLTSTKIGDLMRAKREYAYK